MADSSESIGLDLSGIGLRLDGLPSRLAELVRARWGPFVRPEPPDGPFLTIRVGYEQGELPRGEFAPKEMAATTTATGARFRMPEGRAAVDGNGRAEVRLLYGLGDREYFTLQNLIRACLAWILPNRGGCLLHAAGLVVRGRAFLLVGPAGSGKSTWVRLGEEAGGHALSDDLVLVDGIGPRPDALGAPFCSTHRADYRPGRWPLAAILFPRHGDAPARGSCAPLLARARLTANLSFLVDVASKDPRVVSLVERLAGEVDCADLTFATDPSFVGLLRDWPAR